MIQSGDEPALAGKEIDWIYGDSLMRNRVLSVVIAAPLSTRDANLTVRNVGGSILDLTLNEPSNDQLSIYTPGGGRYAFHDASLVETGRDGDSVYWRCRSSKTVANDGTTATIQYRLEEDAAFVEASIKIEGETDRIKAFDSVRADGWFVFEQSENTAYCSDQFHRQTIGFQSGTIAAESQKPPTWKKGRPAKLFYDALHVERGEESLSWTVRLYPATSPIDLDSVVSSDDLDPAMCRFQVTASDLPPASTDWVNRAEVMLQRVSDSGTKTADTTALQTDDLGIAYARLKPGKYSAVASSIGCEDVKVVFEVRAQPIQVTIPLSDASGLVAQVTDERGKRIPVKATIRRIDGDDPDFGPSSTRTFVENCVYSVHGQFVCHLDPGSYEIQFSHGPEYDSEMQAITVKAGAMSSIEVQLDRVVDTTGWVSTELHSHSSPSGDNTSDQYGRVENLLCEHLEFAPCTEHNRVSSYSPHLEQMGLADAMATCTGIELTGNPLPANHQNAFPMHHHPHTQNGGGPRVSSNPVLQIERLAMWDNGSDKLVQMNHPNLHQVYGDLDTDGTPDKGFRGMLKWMDVVEVHPLKTIFEDVPASPPSVRRMKIPLFQWMQLLNQGHRIPGVINTDAHYNHHGSGWRRNWFASSTDDPAKITTEEMIRQAEAGHIIMSTGPFLSVTANSPNATAEVLPGDDLVATDGKVSLSVQVQCPNWLDVNRVQVFVNGRPSEEHNFTRKDTAQMFGEVESVVKFNGTIDIALDQDAHIIVATIGEGMTMEKVMGTREGKRAPIAVSNPIYVDVDGNGFAPNGDELGLPLPKTSR